MARTVCGKETSTPRLDVANLHNRSEVGCDRDQGLRGVQGDVTSACEGIGRQAAQWTATGQLENANRAVVVYQGDLLRISKSGGAGMRFRQKLVRRRSVQVPQVRGQNSRVLLIHVLN